MKNRKSLDSRFASVWGIVFLLAASGAAQGEVPSSGSQLPAGAVQCDVPASKHASLAAASVVAAKPVQVATTAESSAPAFGPTAPTVDSMLDSLPLSFESNHGQFDEAVKFRVRGQRHSLFLTAGGMVVVLDGPTNLVQTVVRIEFEGGAQDSKFAGIDRLPAIINYFRMGQSITNVPNFARVRQLDVYPGIDVIYHGRQGRLEHDFMVFPGADAAQIRLHPSGHERLSISESGDLLLTTNAGNVMLHKPVAYQEIEGARVGVSANYVLAGNQVRFAIGQYDRTLPLVIDPILSYSTYVTGSTDDRAGAITTDGSGNVYITGETSSTDFPRVGALQNKKLGTYDAFISKLNSSGSGLIYSTYLGGKQGSSAGRGIAVDASGNAYVAGTTSSSSYPVTSGAYKTSGTGGFVTKLSPQGNSLVYSTFMDTLAYAIALDAAGNAYITGQSTMVEKLNAAGSGIIYSRVIAPGGDGQGRGIAVDGAGNAYVTGITQSASFPLVNAFQTSLRGAQDAYVTKLDPTGAIIVYSTYLGGTLSDSGNAVAVDSQGNAYVAGTTYSADFPVLRAFQPSKGYTGAGHEGVNNAFITKFNAVGNALIYSSYLGGQSCLGPGIFSCQPQGDDDSALAIAVDAAGNAYLAGAARSLVFPQVDPIQTTLSPYGYSIPFVAKVQDLATATLVYSAALGKRDPAFNSGAATGIAIDASGSAYVAGHVVNYPVGAFPITPGAFQATATAISNVTRTVVFKLSPGRFTTSLVSSNPAPTSADSITLTATVGSAVPGGTVTFASNGATVGTGSVNQGRATLVTTLSAGVHQLTATYSGDSKASRPLFLPVKQALVCN